ncbi:MAG: twin-arginine translocase subunit TatC [Cellulomonas sp.]|jgi:sec-independent protein translocase protein TatC|nr:twin-arginine translocase subunit TatC [Cellulomonas sp.]
MSLVDHLRELRKRLMWIAVGLLVGMVGSWMLPAGTLGPPLLDRNVKLGPPLVDRAMELLFSPLNDLAERSDLEIAPNFAGVGDPLDLKLRVAFFLGVIVSSPWWIYHLWRFLAPGLTRKERRLTTGFVMLAVVLFLGGVVFAWWAIPTIITLFTEATPHGAFNLIDAQVYLAFTTQIILTFGVTFLLPLFMVALTAARVVRGSTWLRRWRWALVIIAVVSAIVTPTPDVLSMLLVALPLIVLYFAAIGVGVLLDRRADRRDAAFIDASLDLEGA